MSNRLQGKGAVVTGSSKGLDTAIARRFGSEGASVVVNYASSKDAADEVVGEVVKAGGNAVAIKANMREPAEVEQLFSEANRAYGRVDALVNNAGLYDFHPLENISVELFRKHMELNVFGYLLAVEESVRYVPDGGSRTSGRPSCRKHRFGASVPATISLRPPSTSPRTSRAGPPASISFFRADIGDPEPQTRRPPVARGYRDDIDH